MASRTRRVARRRQRQRRAQRRNAAIHAQVMPASRARRRRQGRGLLANLGNMVLPGIGGAVGQLADNALTPIIGNLFGGGRGAIAPVAGAGRLSSLQVNRSRERGVEQIAVLSVPDTTTAGTILMQTLIAAPTIGVRLSNFSKLWTKTKFHRFDIEVVSSNPSSVGGNYTVAIDPDPAQTYQSGPDLPARLMALTMAERANAWANVGLSMKPNPIPLFNRFHIEGASDAEIREYACGQLIVATTTDYDRDCEYIVNVHWDVEFEKPDTTEFVDAVSPSALLMNLTGNNVGVTTGSNTVTFTPTTGIFNRVPNGDFTTPLLGALNVELLFDVPLSFSVTVINYTLSTDTLVLTTGGTPPIGAPYVLGQDPSPYVIDLATRGGLIRRGFGLFHPYLRPNGHETAWKASADAKAQHKRLSKVLERAHEEIAYQNALADLRRLTI